MSDKLTSEQEKITKKYVNTKNKYLAEIARITEMMECELSDICEEYVNYQDHYAKYYNDKPLGIREWFGACNEWNRLCELSNRLFNECRDSGEFEAFDKHEEETAARWHYLERVLAA